MPVRKLRRTDLGIASRAAARFGLATSLIVFGCENLQNAVAEGDTRTISLHHVHTGEDLVITYKRNGRYDDAALKQINHILRDWRRNEEVRMDPRLIDLVWEVQRDVGAKDAIQVVCGYRSPGTNEMLRRRSRNSGVARFSQHTLGKAMDFYIPDARLEDLRVAGLRLQRGGVGFYPTSGSPFVHLDVGNVRHWPRMTRDQLVKVFPDGRTVHIPSDGRPLSGYALALNDIEKRGGEASSMSLTAAKENGVPVGEKRSLLSRLFGFGKNKAQDEDDEADAPRTTPVMQTAQVAPLPAKPVATETLKRQGVDANAAATPLPKARPAIPVQVAQAQPPAKPDNNVYRIASAAPAAKAEPKPVTLADASATGSIAPWPDVPAARDRLSNSRALGYAPPSTPAPMKVIRQVPTSSLTPRVPAALPATSANATLTGMPSLKPVLVTATAGLQDPWLRAVILAPNLSGYLTTTVLGEVDMRVLQPLLQRPSQAVNMTFSDDPMNGMRADSFGGDAVYFVATATFANQTASLR